MKPARLIAILFMVAVLCVMIAVPVMLIGAFGFGVASGGPVSIDVGPSDPVQMGTTKLDKDYTGIAISGPIDLEWKPAKTTSYEISGPQRLVDHMRVHKEDESIRFEIKSTHGFHENVKVVYSGPQPSSLTIAGSGTLTAHGLKDNDLNLSVAGSGDMDLTGDARQADFNVSGSGNIKALGLAVKESEVSIAGSGNVEVNALSKLSANIAGSGNVIYTGSPSIERSIMGSGSVRAKD